VDGTLTSDAANAGAQVGSTEASTLESAGSAVPKRFRRQADKISNGAANVISAAGQPGVASQVKNSGDSVDGQLTGDAATAGAQVGSDVETTLEQTGSDTPSSVPAISTRMRKRQADKISNGAAEVVSAAGQPGVASQVKNSGDSVDGQLTGDAATAGEQVGSDEETTLEQTGSDTPSSVPSVST
jgi:septal ring-binding cell division protein DamX